MAFVIGVDESGSGAWSGPVFVGAVAVDPIPFNQVIGRYLRDSKKMSDARRRKAVPFIKEHAISFSVAEISVQDLNYGMLSAWRRALYKVIMDVRKKIVGSDYLTLIDGQRDEQLFLALHDEDVPVRFVVEADTRFPAVMAAAILAKTARNDVMVGLSSQFPEYGWEHNSGYGVPLHKKACDKYGVTVHHRRIRCLRKCKKYTPQGEWFDVINECNSGDNVESLVGETQHDI